MTDEPPEDRATVRLECPCCGASLVVDAAKGVVLEGRQPADARKEAELKDARALLEEESSRIRERYRQIVEADKGRGASMEQKFKAFLDKAKDEPAPAKPVRDIDLD